MLSDIIDCSSPWIQKLQTRKTSRRHVLFVLSPGDAFVLKQVDDCGYIRWNVVQFVVVHSKVFPADRSDVIRLTGVGEGEVTCQFNALGGES